MVMRRRDVLKCAVALPLTASVKAYEPPMDYARLTAAEAARGIRLGGFTAEDYVEALIELDRTWATLNAFISRDHDVLRENARAADKRRASGAELGPLHGVPIALKDNIATAALPTTAGTAALRDFRPANNAVVAQKLFDAGALLFGKNNMHELAIGITNNNRTFGPARNPYDQAMIPGGSSGGTGAALAARITPAGLGTDTGGSVRIPASLCGATGFRPTTGRYPGDGLVPYAGAMATAGPMARSVEDLVLIDSVITGEMQQDAVAPDSLRIGVPEAHFFEDLDSQVANVVQQALDRLEDAGAILVRANVHGLQELLSAGRGSPSIQETIAGYAEFFRASGISAEDYVAQVVDPFIRERLARSLLGTGDTREAEGPSAGEIRSRYRELLNAYFEVNGLDALAIPSTPMPARAIGRDETVELNGRQVSTFQTYVRNTLVGSAAGLPCVAMPAGMTDSGLPVGIEFDGPAGGDRRLLSIARVMESLLPDLQPPAA